MPFIYLVGSNMPNRMITTRGYLGEQWNTEEFKTLDKSFIKLVSRIGFRIVSMDAKLKLDMVTSTLATTVAGFSYVVSPVV